MTERRIITIPPSAHTIEQWIAPVPRVPPPIRPQPIENPRPIKLPRRVPLDVPGPPHIPRSPSNTRDPYHVKRKELPDEDAHAKFREAQKTVRAINRGDHVVLFEYS